jgi:hypothetical protein
MPKLPFIELIMCNQVHIRKCLIATSKYYFALRLVQERKQKRKLHWAEGLPSSGVPRCATSAFKASNRGLPKLVTS